MNVVYTPFSQVEYKVWYALNLQYLVQGVYCQLHAFIGFIGFKLEAAYLFSLRGMNSKC